MNNLRWRYRVLARGLNPARPEACFTMGFTNDPNGGHIGAEARADLPESEVLVIDRQRQFLCEMCRRVFDKEWSDDVARAEAIAKGIDPEEECGMVCDDCYKLTPWGSDDA